jgi:DNA-binding XRE family transcriptional regulator
MPKADPRMPMPPFSQALRAARIEAGYATQLEAATALSIPYSNWSNLETGKRIPRWPMAWRLIVTLELPLERFFPASAILAAADRLRARKERPPGRRNGPGRRGA